ncbi:MAG TPA: hypothetical protein VF340_03060, partial [Methyloceanibacter sp.]
MAQEQAKTPPPGAAQEVKDEGKSGLEGLFRPAENKSGDTPNPERSTELPRRSTLAERLKAEQRKREEPKRSEARRDETRREGLLKRDETRSAELVKRDDTATARDEGRR